MEALNTESRVLNQNKRLCITAGLLYRYLEFVMTQCDTALMSVWRSEKAEWAAKFAANY